MMQQLPRRYKSGARADGSRLSWRPRPRRTSEPVATSLVGQSHWVVAQHRVDLALHLLDVAVGTGLEPQGEIRVRVRGADQAPAAPREDDAGAVGVDRLVALLELAGDLL